MAAFTNPPNCQTVYTDENKVPAGTYYWKSKEACQAQDYGQAYVGTYVSVGGGGDSTTAVVAKSVEHILNIVDGLITTIAGKGRSILSGISEDVQYVSRQVSNLGDNLAMSTRTLSDQIETSRVSVASKINSAVSTINDHTDKKVGELADGIAANQKQTLARFDKVDQEIAGIGDSIASAIARAFEPVVQAIKDTERDLAESLHNDINHLADKVSNAIQVQGERFSLAINNAANAIDRLDSTTKELVMVVRDGFHDLQNGLHKDLKEHSDAITRAIREGGDRIAGAIATDTAAEVLGNAAIVTAIETGCAGIALAITGASNEQLAAMTPKILKDIEMANIIIGLLSFAGAEELLQNPKLIADIIGPLMQAYFNIGLELTSKFDTH